MIQKYLPLAAAIMLTSPAWAMQPLSGPPVPQFYQWGKESLTQIDKDFWLPQRRLYAEESNLKKQPRENTRAPSFMWSCGVELTALAAAARLDRMTYGSKATSYANALEKYWNPAGPVPGYDVLPGPKSPDRYYDDNAWIVLGLLEIHDVTGEQKYLDKAEATMKFVMSGEDQQLGGGLYWREAEKASKNTCANAPAIVGLLGLYQATKKQEYLDSALRLYAWVRAHLQDQDGLFFDNINLKGEVARFKLTYNTALMIRANCLLYEITSDPKYIAEAQREGKAGIAQWVRADGSVGDAGRFAHLFMGSLLAIAKLDPDPTWCLTIGRTLQFVHNNLKDANGHYPGRWDKIPTTLPEKIALLDQASVARAYLEAATPFPRPKPLPEAKP